MPIDRWFNEYIWPLESNLTETDVYWGALLGLLEMIEGGVTTVADHYFHMDQVARAVEEAGAADDGYDALRERATQNTAYALAGGGTLLYPQPDGTLRPGSFASLGLGVDPAR